MRSLGIPLLLIAACGGGGATTADGAPLDGATTADAAPPDATVVHAGGWRTSGHDASRSFRSDGAGPAATASSTLFAQNTDQVDFRYLSDPLVDEQGNLYFLWIVVGMGAQAAWKAEKLRRERSLAQATVVSL